MDRPRIFISHSSGDKPLTEAIRDVLAAPGADHAGFDVLLDIDCLQAGSEWPPQLHAMMADADAGLLLLTRAAMNRPDWVLKETHILTWRHALQPDFKVFYALLDDVGPADLEAKGFGPARLDLLQRLAASDAPGIAAAVRAGVPSSRATAPTPFEQLADALAENLELMRVDARVALAAALNCPPVPWRGTGHAREVLERIAARLIAGELGSFSGLMELANRLKASRMPPDSLAKVLRWTAPHWVPPGAAARLSAALAQARNDRAAGLAVINGRHVVGYTAKMYVDRILPFGFEVRIARIEGGADSNDAPHYARQICAWLRQNEPDMYSGSDEEIIAALRSDNPFLFVPIPVPDPRTIEDLAALFPTVFFLLWTGPSLASLGAAAPGPILEPEVELAREDREFRDWRAARLAARGPREEKP